MVEGNQFAPDLADFLAYVSKTCRNGLGVNVDDVMREFNGYCKNRYQYSCAETYPWRHPVMYWICCDLRSEMIQRNLSTPEVERLAKKKLASWVTRHEAGEVIPMPKPLLSEKPRAKAKGVPGEGHAAAMSLLAKMRGGKPQTNH